MLGRVDAIESGAADRDGAAAGCKRSAVGGSVDAERQPTGDHQPATRERLRESLGVFEPGRGRAAGSDDGELRGVEQADVADAEQRRRRGADFAQALRIARIGVGE